MVPIPTNDDAPPGGSPPGGTIALRRPPLQTAPLVLSSPHSGRRYPAAFLSASRLDPLGIRRSEDSFVDEIFGAAPGVGAPLLHALFPRAYLDPNREPWELDPDMFEDPLPAFVNTASRRARDGFGTVARVVSSGAEIYRHKLHFDAAAGRVQALYMPYHEALRTLIDDTRRRFGFAILLDCHSMPSTEGPPAGGFLARRPDFVLGDCHGTSCAPALIGRAESWLQEMGYDVERNAPFPGAFITSHYGAPEIGVHALQIEVNRVLYMDERAMTRNSGFGRLARHLTELLGMLARLSPMELGPLPLLVDAAKKKAVSLRIRPKCREEMP